MYYSIHTYIIVYIIFNVLYSMYYIYYSYITTISYSMSNVLYVYNSMTSV